MKQQARQLEWVILSLLRLSLKFNVFKFSRVTLEVVALEPSGNKRKTPPWWTQAAALQQNCVEMLQKADSTRACFNMKYSAAAREHAKHGIINKELWKGSGEEEQEKLPLLNRRTEALASQQHLQFFEIPELSADPSQLRMLGQRASRPLEEHLGVHGEDRFHCLRALHAAGTARSAIGGSSCSF